jgi:hypothetical protein
VRSRARRRSEKPEGEAAGGISEGAVHPSEDFWSKAVDARIGDPAVKDKKVPSWVVEEVKRGCRELNVDCWNITIEVKKAIRYLGEAVFKPDGSVVLRLNELILKDRDLAKAVIMHELVHIKLDRDNAKSGRAMHGHDETFHSMLYFLVPEEEYERLVNERALELAIDDIKSRRKTR